MFEPLEPRLLLSADLAPMADLVQHDPLPAAHIGTTDPTDLGVTPPSTKVDPRAIVFVDSTVAQDPNLLESLRMDAGANTGFVLLDSESDGVRQITEALAGERDVDAVHIVSHGDAGVLSIGAETFGAGSLDAYADQLSSWGEALSDDADILLYGCNLGAGDAGAEFVGKLAALTGADVAASDDLTGSARLGGDGELEVRLGAIETDALALDVEGVLVTVVPGSSSPDMFTVFGNQVTVGRTTKVAGANETFEIRAKEQNDTITFAANWQTSEKLRIDGGDGHDTIDFSDLDENITITLAADGKIGSVKVGNKTFSHVKKIEEIIGHKQKNTDITLDLGAVSEALTIEVGNEARTVHNTVVVKNGADTLITVQNVKNIRGSQASDHFKFRKGKKGTTRFNGWIHGNGGANNVLDFELFDKKAVEIDLSENASVVSFDGQNIQLKKSSLPKKGVANIHSIKFGRGKEGSNLADGFANAATADDAGRTLTGGVADDRLIGGDGTDPLSGGKGEDRLTGGKGADPLAGGANSDRYIFRPEDFLGGNIADHVDTVTENPNEGDADFLDFAAFGDEHPNDDDGVTLYLELRNLATTGVSVRRGSDQGPTLLGPTREVEGFFYSDGLNEVEVFDEWGKFAILERPDAENDSGLVNLNFENVTNDLVFEIGDDGKVRVEEWKLDASGGRTLQSVLNADSVRDLKGGLGNNTFKYNEDGFLHGTLTGGAAAQNVTKVNAIDYSDFGHKIVANLTNQPLTFSKDVRADEHEPPVAPDDYRRPVKETWTYTFTSLDGVVDFFRNSRAGLVVVGAHTGDDNDAALTFDDAEWVDDELKGHTIVNTTDGSEGEIQSNTEDTITAKLKGGEDNEWDNGDEFEIRSKSAFRFDYEKQGEEQNVFEQQFKNALSSVLGRADFSVEQTVNENPASTEWKVTFVEPGPIQDAYVLTLAARDRQPGFKAANATWNVHTRAVDGKFDLAISLNDAAFPVDHDEVTVEDIEYDASPDEIRKQIADEIDALIGAHDVALDVPPVILVSGAGTRAFPWRITFANLGDVGVGEAFNVAKLKLHGLPAADGGGVSTLPAHTVFRVDGNAVVGDPIEVRGITKIVGSGRADRIYSANEVSELFTFNMSQNPDTGHRFEGNDTLLLLTDAIDLRTGQAVEYSQTGPGSSIKGLTSGSIYFVSVVERSATETKIRFHATAEEVGKNAVKIARPQRWAAGAVHHLYEVATVESESGEDVLVASGDRNVLRGADSNDVLVGSDGADYVDGGDGEDKVYGDGSHDEQAGAGRDTVLGGDDKDHVFGNTGPDVLFGGSGNDFLVGGSGSDVVHGEAGDDEIAVIEAGKRDDYDLFLGGKGNDTFKFRGTWGVASIGEKNFQGGKDEIDLSKSPQSYFHVLSDGSLTSMPGNLFRSAIHVEGNPQDAIPLARIIHDPAQHT
ncbi:MAG: DUF4347 domain-containing protein [bacterium]|nr:DUF4347 domain-containing protein [bacterium]